ncbi:hypothetical protein EV401DRAFT_1984279 [Pisolithus croceorrhizus]|nr:hypothetical protein EV401DRAFT_1984279 [Pisolithus croceorrhizus]
MSCSCACATSLVSLPATAAFKCWSSFCMKSAFFWAIFSTKSSLSPLEILRRVLERGRRVLVLGMVVQLTVVRTK